MTELAVRIPKPVSTGADQAATSAGRESMRPLAELFRSKLVEGEEQALAFLKGTSRAGKLVDKSDRELVLHYAIRELLAETIANPRDHAADFDLQTQWESLFLVLLDQSSGSPTKAARHPTLVKACEAEVHSLEAVYALEQVLLDVPPPKQVTPMLASVRTLLNELKGFHATPRAAKEVSVDQGENFETRALQGLGSILCRRLFSGAEGASHFMRHELSDVVGLTPADRETVLFFTTVDLLNRTSSLNSSEKVSGKLASAWSTLFKLQAESETSMPKGVADAHAPVQEAFLHVGRAWGDFAGLETLLPAMSVENRAYLKALVSNARGDRAGKSAQ